MPKVIGSILLALCLGGLVFVGFRESSANQDKFIASKKMQGRVTKILWGDYLYAHVMGEAGEVQFLINGDEDCFLRKHRGELLAIDYDVVDRYTPQASGYRDVNIIRNASTAQTSLKAWRDRVTEQELQKCDRERQ
jgi:hypothetical protein